MPFQTFHGWEHVQHQKKVTLRSPPKSTIGGALSCLKASKEPFLTHGITIQSGPQTRLWGPWANINVGPTGDGGLGVCPMKF